MRIVLCGIAGRYPWGGVTWCSLMYLTGLAKLGHDVWYLEDTCECNYDPDANAIATEPDYALRYLKQSLEPFGFGERWCYVDYRGVHHGPAASKIEEICSSADLFLVLSGGCWVWRDHYLGAGKRVFIDSDPAFTQLALQGARAAAEQDESKKWYVNFFETYDRLFTFGSNIPSGESEVSKAGFDWLPTWQPVDLDYWRPDHYLPARLLWTTVMTWKIESFEDIGGNKDEQFAPLISRLEEFRQRGIDIELAVSGPLKLLRDAGWQVVDAFPVSSDLWRYRSYLSSSLGEFSVAKSTYVKTKSGWFSDRSECYLAAGRPVVVQDTSFSRNLPVGEGLLAWSTPEEAIEALCRVGADYALHARRAREVAESEFDARKVLKSLIDRC